MSKVHLRRQRSEIEPYERLDGNNELSRQMSVEPGQGITLGWEGIEVKAPLERPKKGLKRLLPCLKKSEEEVPLVATEKKILKNVSGIVEPGSFLVIMGSSGSGKTTLLNVLNHRNLGNLKVEGEVRVNGKKIGEDINQVSAYIQQEDLFIGCLTVKEHLMFHAALRMDAQCDDSYRTHRIEEIMEEMGITKCQNTPIGVPGIVKGISGGEMKRLAFGTAVINKPSLLFCDEPTSGLDSYMANSVVQVLKNMAARGRTILCTIHQPSSATFSLFDKILLMAEGRMAYMGAVDEMQQFFADQGYRCPPAYNPADYYIGELAIAPNDEEGCRKRVEAICDTFETSPQAKDIKTMLADIIERQSDAGESTDSAFEKDRDGENQLERRKPQYQASWFKQFYMCFWRSLLDIKNNPKVVPARLLQSWISALAFGFLYFQQTYDQAGEANINGALFIALLQVTFNNAFTVGVTFCREYTTVRREYEDKTYRISAYYFGKIITEIPVFMFSACVYTSIVYFMIGLNPDVTSFFRIMLTYSLCCANAIAIGHFASAATDTPAMSLTILPLILLVCVIFSGFLVRVDSLISIFKPLTWISPFYYGYELLILNQWHTIQHLDCEYTSDSNGTDAAGGCLPNGDVVIYSYGYDYDDMKMDYAILGVIFMVMEILGCFVLWRRASRKV